MCVSPGSCIQFLFFLNFSSLAFCFFIVPFFFSCPPKDHLSSLSFLSADFCLSVSLLPPHFLYQCSIFTIYLSLYFPLQSRFPFFSSFSSIKGGSCYINLLFPSSSSDYSTECTLTHKYSHTSACTYAHTPTMLLLLY